MEACHHIPEIMSVNTSEVQTALIPVRMCYTKHKHEVVISKSHRVPW